MQKLKLRASVRYPEDCQRIQRVLSNNGLEATLHECEQLWETFSEDKRCAQWIIMEDLTDREVWEAIEEYIEFE